MDTSKTLTTHDHQDRVLELLIDMTRAFLRSSRAVLDSSTPQPTNSGQDGADRADDEQLLDELCLVLAEAEQTVRDVEELRAEIRRLRAALAENPHAAWI